MAQCLSYLTSGIEFKTAKPVPVLTGYAGEMAGGTAMREN